MNIPIATYRLQFNSSFGFRSADEIVDYLQKLGISHVYASPILKARENSPHGYDMVNPHQLNPELGTAEDFETLIGHLKNMNMGWVQDIVPNHMAYSYDNPALRDLLEHGTNSSYRDFFDVDFEPSCTLLKGKLAAPFLGDHYERCLLEGHIRLNFDKDGFWVNYYEFKLPLAIASYAELLKHTQKELRKAPGDTSPAFQQFTGIANRFLVLISKGPGTERDDLLSGLKAELWKFYRREPLISKGIDRTLQTFNGNPDDEKSFIKLHKLLSAQFFRLRFWKTAGDEINYRRFFDINDLITIRQDHESVFFWSHQLILQLIDEGKIDGLRIDHIDGLSNPENYLAMLRNAAGDIYLLVEKILEHNESLPESWPVEGTTGYEFSSQVESLFVRQENENALKSVLNKYSHRPEPFEKTLVSAKKQIISSHFTGDLDNLISRIQQTAIKLASGADITRRRLKEALTEILARFPVYRTYLASGNITLADKTYISHAISLGTVHRPDLLYEFEFLQKFFLKTYRVPSDREQQIEALRKPAVTQFEHLTAPLMAKGHEDTALYRYPLLLSLNEVGRSPDQFGSARDSFHELMIKRAKNQPYAMNASSTHDSKRGEDIRARLNVLSEIPEKWEKRVSHWHTLNAEKKNRINDIPVPDNTEEYFIYQTLVGFYPMGENTVPPCLERLEEYMVKALREAKIHSFWRSPDEKYESDVISFIRSILDQSGEKNLFMEDFLPFCLMTAHYGFFNSLSQSLIKTTAPGIPDFYQGAELLNLNLVDPDNRRPVDYKKRRSLIRNIQETDAHKMTELFPEPPALMNTADRLKLTLIVKALKTRKRYPDLFLDGAYIPLKITGRFDRHVLAFARHLDNQWSITVVPRFLTGLITPQQTPLGKDVWQDTAVVLPSGPPVRWKNNLTGQYLTIKNRLLLGELFEFFPTALLTGD
ncbi:MAG: malto-oligosyltrehalose synthase [Desulfobacterales bacterium]